MIQLAQVTPNVLKGLGEFEKSISSHDAARALSSAVLPSQTISASVDGTEGSSWGGGEDGGSSGGEDGGSSDGEDAVAAVQAPKDPSSKSGPSDEMKALE